MEGGGLDAGQARGVRRSNVAGSGERSFELRQREVGSFGNNVYVLVDLATKQSIIIDPAADAPTIPVSYSHLTLPTNREV